MQEEESLNTSKHQYMLIVYSVVVKAAKKASLTKCQAAGLFQVVQSLLSPGPNESVEPPAACCDSFARHFEDKISCICQAQDSTVAANPSHKASRLLSGSGLSDEFRLAGFKDVDNVLGLVCEQPLAYLTLALHDR